MKRKLFTGVAAALLAATAALTAAAPAQASIPRPPTAPAPIAPVVHTGVIYVGGAHPNLAWKSYTWNAMSVGDCTMQGGATWTLYSDGTAHFDGTVGSSDSNDAWLMWMHAKDGNGAELGVLTNSGYQNPANDAEFIQNLQYAGWQYRWLANGTFPSFWFNYLGGMSMESHC